jgi:hypothetical protein
MGELLAAVWLTLLAIGCTLIVSRTLSANAVIRRANHAAAEKLRNVALTVHDLPDLPPKDAEYIRQNLQLTSGQDEIVMPRTTTLDHARCISEVVHEAHVWASPWRHCHYVCPGRSKHLIDGFGYWTSKENDWDPKLIHKLSDKWTWDPNVCTTKDCKKCRDTRGQRALKRFGDALDRMHDR